VAPVERPGLQLFGFPLRVRPFYFLTVAMLGLGGRGPSGSEALVGLALWIVIVTTSIVWHELGHAFAMRRYGYSPSIELHGMGGLTAWGLGPTPTPMQRVVVSLAGPFAGFLLGGLIWAVSALLPPMPAAAEHATELLLQVNIGWGLVNLVPMVPWDGGQALHGLLDRLTGGRGARPTAAVTFVFGGLALAFTALVLRELWLSFLVVLSLSAGYRLWQEGAPRRVSVRAVPPPPPADPGAPIREALERIGPEVLVGTVLRRKPIEDWRAAAQTLEPRLPAIADPAARAEATELAAWARLMCGDLDAAEAHVASMPPSYEPSAALAALLASRRGRWMAALESAGALEDDDEPVRARIEAEALIGLRRPDEVLERLALERFAPGDRATAAFVQESLFLAGHFEHTARLAERAFERFADPDDAYNAACALARLGQADAALGWLERALDAGYRDLEHLDRDADLAAVHALPGYAALRARAAARTDRVA
jgi:Zn-dependent protease